MRQALAQAKQAREFILDKMARDDLRGPHRAVRERAADLDGQDRPREDRHGDRQGRRDDPRARVRERRPDRHRGGRDDPDLRDRRRRRRASAIEAIQAITKEPEVGDTYTGKVVKTTQFGAFVELKKGTDGLLHVSNVGPGPRRPHRGRDRARRRARRDRPGGRQGPRPDRPEAGRQARERLARPARGADRARQGRAASPARGGAPARRRPRPRRRAAARAASASAPTAADCSRGAPAGPEADSGCQRAVRLRSRTSAGTRAASSSRVDHQQRRQQAGDPEADRDPEREAEAARSAPARGSPPCVQVLRCGWSRRSRRRATPSAPPICCDVLNSPDARPASCGADARERGDRHRHEREAEPDPDREEARQEVDRVRAVGGDLGEPEVAEDHQHEPEGHRRLDADLRHERLRDAGGDDRGQRDREVAGARPGAPTCRAPAACRARA